MTRACMSRGGPDPEPFVYAPVTYRCIPPRRRCGRAILLPERLRSARGAMMTRMMRALLAGTIAVCGASPGWGATENSFLVRSTRDLVDVCAPAPSDPLATAAVNFCQGFVVGAYQYYTIDAAATNRQLVCPPSPLPSRNEAIAQFVTWAKARPAV